MGMETVERLSNLNERSPVFELDRGMGKVIDVYDGDTCTLLTMYPGMDIPVRHHVRLFGIDTPEMRPPAKAPDRAGIVAKATRARDALRELVLGKVVAFEVRGKDKYGRMLASLSVEDPRAHHHIDVASVMLERSLGTVYDGSKKGYDTHL